DRGGIHAVVTAKDLGDRARRRNRFLVQRNQSSAKFPASPCGMLVTQANNVLFHFGRCTSWRRDWTPTPVGQAVETISAKSSKPFVPALATDSETLAQLADVSTLVLSQSDKFCAKRHGSCLSPWHDGNSFRSPPYQMEKVLPMSPNA